MVDQWFGSPAAFHNVRLASNCSFLIGRFFFFFFFLGGGRVDENEARSVAQDGSESSSTSDTTPATSFSLHATTDPSSLRSPVAVCVLALGVTCSNGGNSNGKLDAQHSTAQHSGEIGGVCK